MEGIRGMGGLGLRFAAGKHQAVWVGKGIREERKCKHMNASGNEEGWKDLLFRNKLLIFNWEKSTLRLDDLTFFFCFFLSMGIKL